MGWKSSVIFARQQGCSDSWGSCQHDPRAAEQLLAALPGRHKLVGDATLDEGIYPRNGNRYVGIYRGAAIIADMELTQTCFDGDTPPVVDAIDSMLPDATVLAIELHSVVDLYGYALFEGRQLIRGRSGSADYGVFFDRGDPLDEEASLFSESVINSAGDQVWLDEYDGEVVEMDHSSMGEEFVFEVSRRVFDNRLDRIDCWNLQMSEYRPLPLWKRLVSRISGRS